MAYATATELFRILKIRSPSADQTAAAERVLNQATVEIDAEIDRASDATALTTAQTDLLEEVNLQRAAELWKLEEVQFGLVGVGSEFGATRIARDTWEKYALMLAPLKNQWGLA